MSKPIIVEENYYPVLVKNKGWIAVGNIVEQMELDIFSPSEMMRNSLGFRSHFFGSQTELRENFAKSLLWGRKNLKTADGFYPKLSQDYFSLQEADYERLMQGEGKLGYEDEKSVMYCGDEVPHTAFKKLPKGWRRLEVFKSADDAVAALSSGQQKGNINEFYYGLSVSCRGMVRLNRATLPKTEFYWMPDGSVFELSHAGTDWQRWQGAVADPVRGSEIAKRSEDAFAPEERIW